MKRTLLILLGLAVWPSVPGAQELTERQQQLAADHFRAGMSALQSERYDRAETEFRAAVKIDPLYDAAFYGLGQVYMATKRFPDAVRAYLDSREAFKAAVASEALGAAVSDRRLRDQIQALKDHVRSLERMSAPGLQVAIDRNRDRIRQLEVRRNRSGSGGSQPIPAGLSHALGSAYFRTNDLQSAEREYLEAVKVNPDFGEVHNNLAVVYMLTNRLQRAEEEIALAEKAGFAVNPQLKEDLKKRKMGR